MGKRQCTDHTHNYVVLHFKRPGSPDASVFAELLHHEASARAFALQSPVAPHPAGDPSIAAFGWHPPHIHPPHIPLPHLDECLPWYGHPYYLQAVAAIRYARSRGAITSLDRCKDIAGDVALLTAAIENSALAHLIVGSCGRCACKAAF
jgi:hypothetical protein